MNLLLMSVNCLSYDYHHLAGQVVYVRTNKIKNHTSEVIEIISQKQVVFSIYSFKLEITYHGDFFITGFVDTGDNWLPISILLRTK